jgi:hypothetical protein
LDLSVRDVPCIANDIQHREALNLQAIAGQVIKDSARARRAGPDGSNFEARVCVGGWQRYRLYREKRQQRQSAFHSYKRITPGAFITQFGNRAG